jgi:hypothetical protein
MYSMNCMIGLFCGCVERVCEPIKSPGAGACGMAADQDASATEIIVLRGTAWRRARKSACSQR